MNQCLRLHSNLKALETHTSFVWFCSEIIWVLHLYIGLCIFSHVVIILTSIASLPGSFPCTIIASTQRSRNNCVQGEGRGGEGGGRGRGEPGNEAISAPHLWITTTIYVLILKK